MLGHMVFAVFCATNILASLAAPRGNAFLRASAINNQDAQSELIAELTGRFSRPEQQERVVELEATLRPMYAALPKDANGHLEHTVMRYALHRLLSKEHGWFVIGLEPERDGKNMSVQSIRTQMEWAPSYLQDVLESRMGSRGVGLHELAVLAATLEDLAHREAMGRLEATYDIYRLPKDAVLDEAKAINVIDSFSLVFLKGGNWTAQNLTEATTRLKNFKHNHKKWPRLNDWLREVQRRYGRQDGTLSFQEASRVVEQIGYKYGFYNEQDCSGLKGTLLSVEDKVPGRVLLSEFYAKGLHGQWKFTEKVDYLRALGALDENDPDKPRVIVANYVSSRPNCLEASGLYAVCCPNECESLLGHLEKEFAEPTALPDKVAAVVAGLSTPTVSAPRTLSASLISRLDQVAAAHGGRVPLHGRLFAQWMHHAFPRECPVPHTVGTTSPLTADEWIRQTGHATTQASEEEMVCHVTGPCAGGSASVAAQAEAKSDEEVVVEIPWTDEEELLHAAPFYAQVGSGVAQHQSFNRLVRTMLLSGVGMGLAFAAKLRVIDVPNDTLKALDRRGRGWWVTWMLFFCPLLVVTCDYILDFSCVNEFVLCGLCWAAMVAYSSKSMFKEYSLPLADSTSWKSKNAV